MIELEIAPGILDSVSLKPWLIFSPYTTASEVILRGKGSDEFDPLYGMAYSGVILSVSRRHT